MVRRIKKLDEAVVDPSDYVSMNRYTQPLHGGDGRVLTIAETHPTQRPWNRIHPALELDIDQRLYKFLSEMSPVMDEFWDYIRAQSIQKDILFRWHRRRLQLLMETEIVAERERLFKEYVTALLFERVYSQALARRKIFFDVRDKAWEDAEKFHRVHQEMFLERLHRDRVFIRQEVQNPYVPELRKPNEKKVLHLENEDLYDDRRTEQRIIESFQIARKQSATIFDQSLFRGLSLANDQLMQTQSVREIRLVLRSMEARWASLYKQNQVLEHILLSEMRNQSDIMKKINGDRSSDAQMIPRSQQYDGPYKEQIYSESVQSQLLTSLQKPDLAVKEESRHLVINTYDRYQNLEVTRDVQARSQFTSVSQPNPQDAAASAMIAPQDQELDSYHHLQQQAAYPRKLAEALQGEHSFDVPRRSVEQTQEIDWANHDHNQSKERLSEQSQLSIDQQRLENHQRTMNHLLAGHDYARHFLADVAASRPENQISEDDSDQVQAVSKIKGSAAIDDD
ncbi:hypothetical protein [Pseudobacteriovorax antillogorgiicola]|uniref:Uncharacterized protein n=1 Tax=Pseudobacteriovorax antillogorgiicola TaxID=1513793 RepID=A0A1Y6CHE0_9BACT|nr:hypothetical protein [Pseudobacteriovorax antillogorgiicola]TCS47315.1 hypothetical protein EDD56_12190 [Pseudobacteriovorax antillogorgiicola]SMF62761.1 hypothetical protein SAMN06296036_12190 [Pseudobacteriovorax antillogorgiicola]